MRRPFVAIGAVSALLALPACVSLTRSANARYFVLRALAEPSVPQPAGAEGPPVGLLPARLPGHLDRPQLVVWTAAQELGIDELVRWAEPLDEGVTRTLAADLSARLPGRRVVRWPWSAAAPLGARVSVELHVFGPRAGGEVRLEAAFLVLAPRDERALARGTFARSRRTAGGDALAGPGLQVEAMSQLLDDLAAEVAAALEGPGAGEPGKP